MAIGLTIGREVRETQILRILKHVDATERVEVVRACVDLVCIWRKTGLMTRVHARIARMTAAGSSVTMLYSRSVFYDNQHLAACIGARMSYNMALHYGKKSVTSVLLRDVRARCVAAGMYPAFCAVRGCTRTRARGRHGICTFHLGALSTLISRHASIGAVTSLILGMAFGP